MFVLKQGGGHYQCILVPADLTLHVHQGVADSTVHEVRRMSAKAVGVDIATVLEPHLQSRIGLRQVAGTAGQAELTLAGPGNQFRQGLAAVIGESYRATFTATTMLEGILTHAARLSHFDSGA